MPGRGAGLVLAMVLWVGAHQAPAQTATSSTAGSYLLWSEKEARTTALAMRVSGRVGKRVDFRGLHTDRSISYKLRATWMTPDVIRASSRLEQLARQLSPAETSRLVQDAESAGDTVVMVELDPDEGSGIIPSEWMAQLGPSPERAVRGEKRPNLDSVKALAGASRRDYNYDVFWFVFPLQQESGAPLFRAPLFRAEDNEAVLTIRVNGMQGSVKWGIPESVRQLQALRSSR